MTNPESTGRTSNFTEKDFIKFLKSIGITVKTNTKARGHLGICYKNRIDISKKVSQERRIAVLAHEYAHKIHYDMEKETFNQGGSLEKLFKAISTETFFQELLKVTNFVDNNSLFENFYIRKEEIRNEIQELSKIIRADYPDFKRTQHFKPASAFFKANNIPAKHLLKYDYVRMVHSLKKDEVYSVRTIDEDFAEIPESFRAYIKLRSREREYKRYYKIKNRAENYYKKPTELFARLVEGLFINPEKVIELAPETYERFKLLLCRGYYGNLKDLFQLAEIKIH